MGRWLVQMLVQTALVGGALWAGVWSGTHPSFVVVGLLFYVVIVLFGWLALAAAVLRALRDRANGRSRSPVPRALWLMSRPASHQYFIGAFLAFIAGTLIIVFARAASPDPPRVGAVLAIGFAMAAALVCGWSYGVDIDGASRRLARWRGPRMFALACRLFEREYQIPADAKVSLRETFRSSGKNGGYWIYLIEIEGPSVLVNESRDPDVARLRAEQVAKVLSLDLVDRTALDHEERRRAVAQLDLPLSEQLRLRGSTTGKRPLPAGTRLTLVSDSDELPWLVRVGPAGLRARDVFAMIILTPFIFLGSLVPATVAAALADRTGGSVVLSLALLITVAVAWFAVWRMFLRTRRETQLVSLSPAEIRVARRAPGTHSAGQLSADQIEEIVVAHNRERGADGLVVVARGDGVSLAFGHELGREDAIWLRDTAIAALAPRSIYR